ncbi:capping complex subunit for YIEGIA [Radiobacillus sp. PE A8.2]|uniref:capping complex subunit for YIEGIA n=1 Tax=Radiobacillus sp. PE A8.2 TaxID=3380349 RepID=UPI00388EFD5D
MGRESSMKPDYQILAYVTMDKERVLSSSCLSLLANSEEDLKEMTVDIAKGLKADVVRLTNGDQMVIRV